MPVKAIPEGYSSVTPYLTVKDGAEAIEFYKKAFGAVERMRMPMPDGRVGHAELKIGTSVIMLASECPDMPGAKSPQSLGGTPVGIYLYVENVDDVVKQATAAGATLAKPVENQFYGDRTGMLTDPFGHRWNVATHVEDVAFDEVKTRMAAMMGKKAA